ncbi:MAG: hypothetical protein J6B01_06775 [Ruminococcus sp.]|nr:hypothetical protein [Ruminococcus sp.]
MNIPDNLDMFDRYDNEQARMLERLPKCCNCGQAIQQEMAVRIGGKWYCDSCLDIYFRESVEEIFS